MCFKSSSFWIKIFFLKYKQNRTDKERNLYKQIILIPIFLLLKLSPIMLQSMKDSSRKTRYPYNEWSISLNILCTG